MLATEQSTTIAIPSTETKYSTWLLFSFIRNVRAVLLGSHLTFRFKLMRFLLFLQTKDRPSNSGFDTKRLQEAAGYDIIRLLKCWIAAIEGLD